MLRFTRLLSSLLLPFLAVGTLHAQSAGADGSDGQPASDPYGFDATSLESIRYSRIDDSAERLSRPHLQTEFSLRVQPGRFEFSRDGIYGLGVITQSQLALRSRPRDPLVELDLPNMSRGLSYSAGVRIERDDEHIDGTAYVSSSLLGLSYGRLGRLWYGGIDVNLERFDNEWHGEDQPDVLSLDFTTGRRLGLTGLDSDSPMWLLSLQGDFDLYDSDQLSAPDDEAMGSGEWYLNPSLFWERPDFTFSAQMQVPVETESAGNELDTPDYGLRAVFEKRF